MAIPMNQYNDLSPFGQGMSQQEYEFRKMKEMLYAQQQAAMTNVAASMPPPEPEKPKKPKHLNQKLLLTKG